MTARWQQQSRTGHTTTLGMAELVTIAFFHGAPRCLEPDNAVAKRDRDRVCPVAGAKLAHRRLDVLVNRSRRYGEQFSDLARRSAICHQMQNLGFSGGQLIPGGSLRVDRSGFLWTATHSIVGSRHPSKSVFLLSHKGFMQQK